MPSTRSGVYHNLRESKYTISNKEVVFFFSSDFYRCKFMDTYKEHREEFKRKIEKSILNNTLNIDTLADITLYKLIEKRGFFVRLKGSKISWEELHKYAIRKMTEKESPEWELIQTKLIRWV